MISTAAEIQSLAEVLAQSEIIAFDTEFIRESTFFPIVEIIQVATETQSWLVDAQAFKRGFRPGDTGGYDPALKPLLDIFTNPKILKIVHAAQGDQECLFTSFGVVASPSLDTAVAASLCGLGDGIGLGNLLKAVLGVSLTKGHARTNWSVRPLPQQLEEYAHADVTHLVELGKKLMDQLAQAGRKEWALELSAKWEDKSLYQSDIEELTKKLAKGGRLSQVGHGALRELVKWREERVRNLNLPRRWVADDHVLLDLAHVRPKDMDHLGTFRGLNKGELKKSGETILEALRRGEQAPEVAMPKVQRTPSPSADETQTIELLRCFLGILADRHKVAAKHLLTTAKLLLLLRTPLEKPADLVTAGILSEEASRLIGDELVAMMHGKRALRVNGKEVQVVET